MPGIFAQSRRRFLLRAVLPIAIIAATVSIFGAAAAAPAESPQALARANANAMAIDLNRGAAGLSRWLAAIRTRASILMVTAHPDDEDGGMLASQSRGLGARTTLLTLNRGEGGQNAMSGDLYDALGLVRTEELLKADQYYGVDQYWGTVIDYGFSKTREEALEKWGHDRVLADVVRVVRMTRPLVITSVFAGAPTGTGTIRSRAKWLRKSISPRATQTAFPSRSAKDCAPGSR
jgi:hypothetical protein